MNHILSGVGLCVPDLKASVEHVTAVLGLAEVKRSNGQVNLALPGQTPCLTLIKADAAGIDFMTLTTTERNLAEVTERARARGLAVQVSEDAGSRSIQLLAPNGVKVNLVADEPPSRNRIRRTDGPTIGSLDHLSFTARDAAGFVDFFQEVLGFRLTDSVGDKRFWLRCGQNHHAVAVFGGEDGLQHYAFEADDLLEIKRLGDLLASRDQNFLWGPGRHGLGENIFSYHLDPAGAILEVCTDMLQITDEESWKPQIWREDTTASAIMWGQLPPPEFRSTWIPTTAGVKL
jgi:catechol 2,3-dioxygenase